MHCNTSKQVVTVCFAIDMRKYLIRIITFYYRLSWKCLHAVKNMINCFSIKGLRKKDTLLTPCIYPAVCWSYSAETCTCVHNSRLRPFFDLSEGAALFVLVILVCKGSITTGPNFMALLTVSTESALYGSREFCVHGKCILFHWLAGNLAAARAYSSFLGILNLHS